MRKDGLTEQEGKVMDALVAAYNEYLKLDIQHSSDLDEFTDGIHKCQHVLTIRILRRDYPEGYPIKVDPIKKLTKDFITYQPIKIPTDNPSNVPPTVITMYGVNPSSLSFINTEDFKNKTDNYLRNLYGLKENDKKE